MLAFFQTVFTFYHQGFELAKDFDHYKRALQINIQNVRRLYLYFGQDETMTTIACICDLPWIENMLSVIWFGGTFEQSWYLKGREGPCNKTFITVYKVPMVLKKSFLPNINNKAPNRASWAFGLLSLSIRQIQVQYWLAFSSPCWPPTPEKRFWCYIMFYLFSTYIPPSVWFLLCSAIRVISRFHS